MTDIITRTPENPIFEAIHFSSWNQVRKDLKHYDFESDTVVSDLSQGAWKGHWIAYELQAQLELSGNEFVQPVLNTEDYADIVGKLIDNESEGDRNFALALKICKTLKRKFLEQDIKLLIIIPPKNGYDWQQENLQLMKLLYDALRNTNIRIILIDFPNAHFPEDWTLRYLNEIQDCDLPEKTIPFFPGIMEQTIASELGIDPEFTAKLRNGYMAIDPLIRSEEWNWTDHLHLATQKEYLAPVFELMFSPTVIRENIEKQALIRFAEGGYGIALQLFSMLLPKLNIPLEKESVRIQMQNIRIALLSFKDAADEEIPTDELPDMLKASLNQSKAWGLVMDNRPLEAEPYFEKARQYLDEKTSPRLYLYLLNISALNKLRLGEIDKAFVYEKRIEETLSILPERDWHVTYINYINQARLYKKVKDFEQAEAYYDKAFSINTQLKNESDLLYTNLCYAQLEELKGNEGKAFFFYLRTCIHWLSNDMPEALAPRVAQAILIKKLSNAKGEVEDISQKLRLSLQNLAEKLGLEIGNDINSGLNFIRLGNIDQIPNVALGQSGWGVCLSEIEVKPPFSGKEYDNLKSAVTSYLQLFFPGIKWNNYQTIVTDTQFSCELPSTFSETILVAWRSKIPNIIFKDKAFLFTDKDMADLNSKIKVGISPAINYIAYEDAKMKVYFKRYRSAVLLNEKETGIMQHLQQKDDCLFNELGHEDEIRNLEEKRLIQLYY